MGGNDADSWTGVDVNEESVEESDTMWDEVWKYVTGSKARVVTKMVTNFEELTKTGRDTGDLVGIGRSGLMNFWCLRSPSATASSRRKPWGMDDGMDGNPSVKIFDFDSSLCTREPFGDAGECCAFFCDRNRR